MPSNKEEEAKYKKRIADLHAELETSAKKLGEVNEQRDANKRERDVLASEVKKLQGQISELKHDIDNLGKGVKSRSEEAEATLKKTANAMSAANLELSSLDFNLKQTRARIAELSKKEPELSRIEERYTAAKVSLSLAEEELKEAKARVAQADTEAGHILGAIKARDEKSQLREAKTQDGEAALKAKNDSFQFYFNRIVAYCVEKGLPPPTLNG